MSDHPITTWRKTQSPEITTAELARRVGTSKPNLWRIEYAGQAISSRLLPRLVAQTGLSPNQLFASAFEAAE